MPRPRKHDTKLPPYVRERHGAYHYDRPGVLTKKLCRVSDGLPAMHEALAATLKSLAEDVPTKGMPRLCVEWERLKHQDFGLLRYRPKVRKEYGRMLKHIGDAKGGWFKNFDVHQVKSHHIATVLDTKFPDKPRTHNAYRALLSLLFKWAIRKGLRQDNPCAAAVLQTVKESRRKRYITDDELAIIKANGDAKLGLVIDLAYITGQRIGDLIALTWASVSDKGILFLPSKVEDTTEIPVPVKMTDQLRAVLEGLKGGVEPLPTAPVIRTQTGGRYTYSGMYSAWRRACLPADQTRPRVLNAHIHDLRRKALTDMRDQRGEAAAQALAGHASPEMTRHYMEQTELKWVEPVRLGKAG
jgi:integrase